MLGPSSRLNADVDYIFAPIGVKDDEVDFSNNCGNMTSAVGPFAVNSNEKGLVNVRIHNTNSGKIIHSMFAVEDGKQC